MNPARLLPALAAALSLATAAAYLLWDHAAPRNGVDVTESIATAPTRRDRPESPPTSPAKERTTPPVERSQADEVASDRSETALMSELRARAASAPLEAIELAQRLNERFPESAHSPERGHIVAKALVALRRFHEAQQVAREMKVRHPGNPYALDVERHLLVYPLGMPSREEQQHALNEH